jgi:hypothetical protein
MAGQAVARRGVSAVLARTVCACLLSALSLGAMAVPTHFGTVLGNGLLCRDETSNRYYFDYMVRFFGQPYKRQGGAYWFRTPEATLWGYPVREVIVSDESWHYSFVGALADATPEKLEEAIAAQDGVRYAKIDRSRFPVRETRSGGRIVYANRQAKIYCAKFKPLPPALR